MVDFEKQEQEVDALIQSLADGKQVEGSELPAPEPAIEQAPAVEPEPTAEEPSSDLITEPFDPYAGEADPDPEKEEDFEHKYKVLQGMYRKQVVEVQEINRRLTASNADLSAQVDQLRGELAAAQAAPGGQAGTSPVDDVDLSVYDEYGPEIRAMAENNVRLTNELRQMRAEVAEVGKATSQAAEERFFQYMDANVPNWRKQDADQEFVQWLQILSPDTGRPKQDSLQSAYKARDGARVAAIFIEYRNFLALQRSRQAAERPSGDVPAPQRKRPSPAPVSRPGQAPASSRPKYTLDDWSKLQDRAQKGEFNNNPGEYARLEAEIHAVLFPKGK